MKKVSRYPAILAFLFTILGGLYAQKPAYLKLEFDKNQKPYVFYPVTKGDHPANLAKLFGSQELDVRAKNRMSTGQSLVAGTIIQIPINTDKIIKKNLKGSYNDVVPIFYKVKKGETAYRIVKVNLKDDLNNFCERNDLPGCQLKVGADVLVGWIDLRDRKQDVTLTTPKEKKTIVKTDPKTVVVKGRTGKNEEPTIFKKVVAEKKPENSAEIAGFDNKKEDNPDPETEADNVEVWVADKGVAYWQHGHRANSNKYVLHNSAAINSIIELYNPMLRRTVRAKVIGRIPEETYRNDIDVVLSEGAAESLGALDSRFQIEMRYKK